MRSRELFLASATALGGLGLAGCPSDPEPMDAAMPSMNDAFVPPGEDAPMMMMDGTPTIRVGSMAMPMDADVSCLGMNTAPMAGDPVMGTVRVEALAVTAFPVASAALELYPGDTIRAMCDGDCVMATTNAMGEASVTLPSGGWFGYRLPAAGSGMMGTVPVLGYFYTFPSRAGERVTVTAISTTAAMLVANSLNRELNSTTAAVSGSVRDCMQRSVANVRIRMFRGDTEIVSGPAGDTSTPRITGLNDGAIPAVSPDGLTRFNGRFAGVVPASGGAVRIEAWGVTEDGGAPRLLGCEEVLVEPATVTVAVIPALRGDYPSTSSCRR